MVYNVLMNKLNEILFPNKGKDKWYMRLYIVLCYGVLTMGIVLSAGFAFNEGIADPSRIDAIADILRVSQEYIDQVSYFVIFA